MRLIKGLATTVIALALLAVPAGALAKRGDRDHDKMPDKWEKAHHLDPRAKDARKDADHDGLRNISEFRHHTDPQNADTDDDGIDDENEVRDDTNPRHDDSDDDGIEDADEIAGTITSFDNGLLTIQLPAEGAGTVAGTVTDATKIECDDDDAPVPAAATTSRDGSDDTSDDDSDSGSNSGPGSGSDDDNGDDHACTTADLKVGARVHEAKLVKNTDGSMTFTKIELVPGA